MKKETSLYSSTFIKGTFSAFLNRRLTFLFCPGTLRFKWQVLDPHGCKVLWVLQRFGTGLPLLSYITHLGHCTEMRTLKTGSRTKGQGCLAFPHLLEAGSRVPHSTVDSNVPKGPSKPKLPMWGPETWYSSQEYSPPTLFPSVLVHVNYSQRSLSSPQLSVWVLYGASVNQRLYMLTYSL